MEKFSRLKHITRDIRNRALHLVRADKDGVLPIHLYRPESLRSESREWFQTTLKDRSTFRPDHSVVVVAAHQDDETEFLGGTIKQLADRGYAVTVVHMTDGRYGADDSWTRKDISKLVQTRLEESIAAAQELGVYRLINLGIPDTEINSHDKKTIDKLVAVMRQEGSSIFFTQSNAADPLQRDGHPDHQDTFYAVAKAAFKAHLHLYPSRRGRETPIAQPTLYTWDPQSLQNMYGQQAPVELVVNTTNSHDAKVTAFRKYRSQVNNGADYVGERAQQDQLRGRGIFAYAEGLTQYKPRQFIQTNVLEEMLGKENIAYSSGKDEKSLSSVRRG